MFNKIYEIKYNDIDKNGILKPHVFLEYLEDIAAVHANVLGFGYDQIYPNGIGWFLLKYAMNFKNYPQNIHTLKIETEPRGANKLFTYRDFYIYNNETNELLGQVASTWALVDLKTTSILNPLEKLADIISEFVKRDNDLNYTKIPKIIEPGITKEFPVKYFDIDVNNHVNNSVYLLWALETLSEDFISTKKIKKLDINYKKQITLGNNVLSLMTNDNNKTVHNLKNKTTDEDLCNILIEWSPELY